jgi:hypothetical protein
MKSLLIFILVFTVSIVSLFLVKKIYSVSEIEVKGGQIKDTNVLLGKLIFFIDTDGTFG